MRTRSPMLAAGIVLGALAAGPAPQGTGAYAPGEWESITRTRHVRSLAVGPRFVAMATEGGLLFYDRSARRFKFPLTQSDGMPVTRFDEVSLDETGSFMVRSTRGDGRVDPISGNWYPGIFQRTPQVQAPRLPSNLFSAPGYQYLDEGRLSGPDGIPIPILEIRPDDDAGMWVATWGLGAGRADLRTLRLEMLPHGLWTSDVRALLVDDTRLVAGGWSDPVSSGGLTFLDRGSGRWEYVREGETLGLDSDVVSALAGYGPDVFAGVDGGVARGSPGRPWRTWSRRDGLPDGRVTALQMHAGDLWIGTWRGAAVLSADTLSTVGFIGTARVRAAAAGQEGIWLATEAGVYGYRGRWPAGKPTALRDPGGLVGGGIEALAVSGREVWFAGPGGVAAYDAGRGAFLAVAGSPLFRPGEVSSIAADAGNVWVGTSSGAWRLIRRSGEWHRYTSTDGLIDSRIQCIVLHGSDVWFGTPAGITRFDTRLRRDRP